MRCPRWWPRRAFRSASSARGRCGAPRRACSSTRRRSSPPRPCPPPMPCRRRAATASAARVATSKACGAGSAGAMVLNLTLPRWPGWRHLPRDARDTLFLLGVIAWTLLPHLTHLPWWCAALTAVVLLWRMNLALANATLPGRWVLVVMLTIAAGLTWWTERTLLGKEAGVTLLVVLMALKTLELRARRDAFVVFFLGFFLVLTQFLYSQ